jgi:hypothetical protein
MRTALLVLSLALGLVGTFLSVVSLRFIFELLLHLPEVQEQMHDEKDDPRLRDSRIWMFYRALHR